MAAELVQLLGITLVVAGMAAEVIGTVGGVCYPLRKRIPLTPLELVSAGAGCFFGGLLVWVAAAFTA